MLRVSLVCFSLLALSHSANANNVQSALEGSVIKIFGDNAANDIVISQNSAGTVTVLGRNGTTVNNAARAIYRNLNLSALEVLMNGGNDIVALRGIRTGNDLFVNLGAGNDVFTADAAVNISKNAAIEGEAGTDRITLTGSTVGEDLNIDGGIGALTARVNGVSGGKSLTIIGDALTDTVSVTDSEFGDLVSIETKEGTGRITIARTLANLLAISTSSGRDVINVTDAMLVEDVGIFTGLGNDDVTLANVESGKSLTVSVDGGNDVVTGQNVVVAEDAVFEGGDGVDVIEDAGIVGGQKKEIKEFEIEL